MLLTAIHFPSVSHISTPCPCRLDLKKVSVSSNVPQLNTQNINRRNTPMFHFKILNNKRDLLLEVPYLSDMTQLCLGCSTTPASLDVSDHGKSQGFVVIDLVR